MIKQQTPAGWPAARTFAQEAKGFNFHGRMSRGQSTSGTLPVAAVNIINTLQFMKTIEEVGVAESQQSNPSSDGVYALAEVERMVHLPRRTILAYCRQGLVAPAAYFSGDGFYFDAGSVAVLRRMKNFCGVCGVRPEGIKLILNLMNTIAQLRSSMTLKPPTPDE